MSAKRDPGPAHGQDVLTHLLPVLPIAALVVLEDGTIVAANAAAEALALAALPGRRLSEVLTDGQGGEALLRAGDSSSPWVMLAERPVQWQGQAARLLTLQDISALKQREGDLTRARDEADQAGAAKMRFFAAASHDLRQPLQALALFVSALESQVRTPQAERIFESLKVSLRSMEEMFESLLDMSRLDAGVLRPEPAPFMVGDMLETLETEFAAQAQQSGLRLRVVYSSLAVYSDQEMLTRILRNYISNAFRYTRGGGILVGCRRRGRALRLEVWDSGVGIAPEQQVEIFNEFVQGKAAVKRKGSGLGLAIVQRLARLLGHRLDLRSAKGKGSMFAVEVPLADGPDDSRDDGTAATALADDVRGAVVVVVDDDIEILKGVEMLLDQWGGRAVTARTAEEAAEALRRDALSPDLILADDRLHAGSGPDSIRRLRRQAGESVPAFLFTGSTTDTADGLGFPVLRKPLDPSRLRAVLADLRG